MYTFKMSLAMASKIEARNGYQPFRVSRNVIFPLHGAFFIPKKSIYVSEAVTRHTRKRDTL